MGFFKDMKDLSKMGKEMSAAAGPRMSPGEMMADAKERMANANAMMARQAQAAQLAMTGLDATAAIGGMRQVGQANFDALVEFQVTVMRDGAAPYPATVQQSVPQLQLGVVGQATSVPAKVDPSDPTLIWLNLTAPA
jgi:hypothetical protein